MVIRLAEIIDSIEVLESGDVLLRLRSGGRASYQHIYREAKGVYWEQAKGGFRSNDRKEWSVARWFAHIVDVCADVSIYLKLAEDVRWVNVDKGDRAEILGSTVER